MSAAVPEPPVQGDSVPLAVPVPGPVFAVAHGVLSRDPAFSRFRSGALSQADWNLVVERNAESLVRAGFPAADIPFLKRIPPDPDGLVGTVLDDLVRRGFALASGPDTAQPDGSPEGVDPVPHPDYAHGACRTFIYPEEGVLLARIAARLKPARTVFLGSYYGFWARFAAPVLAAAGGTSDLVDPDPAVCELARRNLVERRDWNVSVHCQDGESFLETCEAPFDMVVLDAELPRDHPDPDRCGKGLYYHLLRAVLPHCAPGAVLVVHNILFQDHTGDRFFEDVIARNRRELGPFMSLAQERFGLREYPTTEGVGIGRLGEPGAAGMP